jgi:hypothetical protein
MLSAKKLLKHDGTTTADKLIPRYSEDDGHPNYSIKKSVLYSGEIPTRIVVP